MSTFNELLTENMQLLFMDIVDSLVQLPLEQRTYFFGYEDEEDYAVSYDAFFEKELYQAKGRRSKKREVEMLDNLRGVIDQLAEAENGKVFWDQPLREARRG